MRPRHNAGSFFVRRLSVANSEVLGEKDRQYYELSDIMTTMDTPVNYSVGSWEIYV